MLYLPQVTLCINDTRNHELARLALEDSIRDIEFGEILVISDQPFQLSKPYRFERMPDLASGEEWGFGMVRDFPKLIRTDFVLQIQFDLDHLTSCWQDEFYPTITSGHRGDGSKTTGTLAVVDSLCIACH